jgi:hypothetical protein
MRTVAGVLAILIGTPAGPGGSQEPPTRSIPLQIVERDVRGMIPEPSYPRKARR